MENDQAHQPDHGFQQIHMRMSNQYPHSHHGTPASEYLGFNWHSPPDSVDSTGFGPSPPQRPNHHSLHLVTMPTWPSMLGSQASPAAPAYYPTITPQSHLGTVSPTPLMTPTSASPSRSGTIPRRTLSDDERRKICEHHDQNPSAKQSEIASKLTFVVYITLTKSENRDVWS